MDWLEHDEVELDALPPWARDAQTTRRARAIEVRFGPEGLAVVRGKRASALRWEDVLVLVRPERARLLVAAARRPPRPPWFELAGPAVEEIEVALRTRLEAVDQRGYRQPRRSRAVLDPEQVLAAVLAREAVPGAVEIPAATPGVARSSAIGATVGGGTMAFYGLLFGPVGMAVAAGVGALTGGVLMGGIEYRRKRTAGRVLVLTPDAFVGGLDGQKVRSVGWSEVGRFIEGADPLGEPALEVLGRDGVVLARVPARYFGAPLHVIVAVAEAYRRRTAPE